MGIQLSAGRGCVQERLCWQTPRVWLCCHLIYQATREHLSSLTQNPCHNPGLKLSLNLSWVPCPLLGLCCCWQSIPAAVPWDVPHWAAALASISCSIGFGGFYLLIWKKGMRENTRSMFKNLLCSQYWNIFYFLIKTLPIKMLWLILILGCFYHKYLESRICNCISRRAFSLMFLLLTTEVSPGPHSFFPCLSKIVCWWTVGTVSCRWLRGWSFSGNKGDP